MASAHCDTMDGPVVKAAQKALETGDVNHVLIWVRKADEVSIRDAFTQTWNVRKLNSSARELADRYFFETVVRIHRAGEGEPYTGLKPAGTDIGQAVVAADKALSTGDVTPLMNELSEALARRIAALFAEVKESKAFQTSDAEAGREYVRRYVMFIHLVEKVHADMQTSEARHEGGGHLH
jgi:hypothetical protein